MSQQLATDAPASEALPLASEMAAALSRYVEAQKEHRGLNADEAIEELDSRVAAWNEIAEKADPSSATFFELARLTKADPDRAKRKWDEVRAAARAELQSGHRAAKANEVSLSFDAWPRASFLALREELGTQTGLERVLVDSLTHACTAQLFWHERLMMYACLETDNARTKRHGEFVRPRLDDAQAMDQAAEMVERFNRIFIRTMRMLKELRRQSPTFVVQNAGQVNVADKQINVG
jgi:hypothetical protein